MVVDPADLTAIEARQLISRRALSPVELAKACIARTESINHAVNAVISQDFGKTIEEAKAAEAAVMSGKPLGLLHGLPVGVKDMIDVAGLPTTFGSEIFKDSIAAKDSALVTSMRAAGAVVLGKTNNPEFSAGANTRNNVYGVTANPYDLTKSCAGSSGGSAVALATGMAPLCTGSDLGGSLRNPAAFCSVVGFRPSPGVVPDDARGMALMPMSTLGLWHARLPIPHYFWRFRRVRIGAIRGQRKLADGRYGIRWSSPSCHVWIYRLYGSRRRKITASR